MQPKYERYARVGHRTVRGWLDARVLVILQVLAEEQERSGVHGAMAEIGVHHGKLFIALHLARSDGERSLAIDLFDQQDLNVDRSGKGDRPTFMRNLERHADGDEDVTVLSADSTTLDGPAVGELIGPVRLFSVDGGHTADIVDHDMQTASESLTPGGIVVADDVFNDQWPGVQEGTYRFVARSSALVPFAIAYNKTWFTTSHEYANNYRRIFADVARTHWWVSKSSDLAGAEVVISWRAKAGLLVRMNAKRLLRR